MSWGRYPTIWSVTSICGTGWISIRCWSISNHHFDSQQKIKLRRPAQAIYEHKIWVLLDIDQVMIDIQSWRESLTSDVETSRGILERGPYSYLCGHRRAKGSKSVEVLHFYYLAHSWHARDEVAWTLPNILWAQQNQNGNAGSKSVEVLHFYYLWRGQWPQR